jgi:hypothetical protein
VLIVLLDFSHDIFSTSEIFEMKPLTSPIHRGVEFSVEPAAYASGFPPVVETAAYDTA